MVISAVLNSHHFSSCSRVGSTALVCTLIPGCVLELPGRRPGAPALWFMLQARDRRSNYMGRTGLALQSGRAGCERGWLQWLKHTTSTTAWCRGGQTLLPGPFLPSSPGHFLTSVQVCHPRCFPHPTTWGNPKRLSPTYLLLSFPLKYSSCSRTPPPTPRLKRWQKEWTSSLPSSETSLQHYPSMSHHGVDNTWPQGSWERVAGCDFWRKAPWDRTPTVDLPRSSV